MIVMKRICIFPRSILYLKNVRRGGIFNENVSPAVEMKAARKDANQGDGLKARQSECVSQFQVSMLLLTSSRSGVIEEGSIDVTEEFGSGLGLRRTRVMERPASWRASINEVNVSPVLPLPKYVSSCSSGNSSKDSSPSSNSRQRDSS